MKLPIILSSFLFLAACAKGGSGPSAKSSVPINGPSLAQPATTAPTLLNQKGFIAYCGIGCAFDFTYDEAQYSSCDFSQFPAQIDPNNPPNSPNAMTEPETIRSVGSATYARSNAGATELIPSTDIVLYFGACGVVYE